MGYWRTLGGAGGHWRLIGGNWGGLGSVGSLHGLVLPIFIFIFQSFIQVIILSIASAVDMSQYRAVAIFRDLFLHHCCISKFYAF